MCRHDDDPETIAHTSGRAIPDIEVLVVDAEGKEVPRGEPGEIVVRGYNVMQRLPRRPRADRRGDRRRRLAAHRRRRHDGRTRLRRHHRPREGHVHHRRVQRVSGRDRGPHAAPPAHRPGGGRRRPRRPAGRGRHGVRRSRARAPRPTPPRSSRGAATRWPTTRRRATSRSSTTLPLNASGKVLKFEHEIAPSAHVDAGFISGSDRAL